MADVDAALATQLKNIEARTGRSLAELEAMVAGCGQDKHAGQRSWLMKELGLGYGDANTIAHLARKGSASAAPSADPLDALYTGAKVGLRPVHEALMAQIQALGDFEQAPKQKYVSLRRKKQFAMLGPATRDQVELGLNAKDLPDHPRIKKLPPGGMCQATVRIGSVEEIDATLLGWVRVAYDAAG